MRHQKELLLARKKELRIILKEFESTFMGLHGRYDGLQYSLAIYLLLLTHYVLCYSCYLDRTVSRADRKPMQNEYDEYKVCSTSLVIPCVAMHYCWICFICRISRQDF